MMYVGDTAGKRVLDRDHRQIGLAVFHGEEGFLERLARQRLHLREHVAAGHVRIGAEVALEGDLVVFLHHGPIHQPGTAESSRRAFSRSAGVSTPSGTVSTISTSMRRPASSARNCSSDSRRSRVDGGSETKVS